LIAGHRATAGTIEHVHDETQNDPFALLRAGSGRRALAERPVGGERGVVSDRVAGRPRDQPRSLQQRAGGLALAGELHTAKRKKLRRLMFALCGRMHRTGHRLKLRFGASVEAIRRRQRIWEVFALPTPATTTG
jgi:hypothetical protein